MLGIAQRSACLDDMAEGDDMPQLVDEDEEMPDDEFFSFWLNCEPENCSIEQVDGQEKTFGGLPLTYEDILADEPDPLSDLCRATILASLKDENAAAILVAMKKCKGLDSRSTLGPGLPQRLYESVLRRFTQTTAPVGRRQLPT